MAEPGFGFLCRTQSPGSEPLLCSPWSCSHVSKAPSFPRSFQWTPRASFVPGTVLGAEHAAVQGEAGRALVDSLSAGDRGGKQQ